MTKDEALKLALDAFGEIAWSNETQWQRDRAKEAITAIREALAQPEHSCVACEGNPKGNNNPCAVCGLIQPEQEPVAFYVYKPTLPRGNLGNVSDGALPWVYDQDPSSGYSARMLVYTTPPHRKPLTDEEIVAINDKHYNIAFRDFDADIAIARAIEAAHGIKE